MIERFASLLYSVIGLDPQSIGLSSIERAVRQRMAARQTTSATEYLAYLQSSPAEVQALVEDTVVPETWFFRDPGAFGVVADYARNTPKLGKLHFLCIPCSTGEEPYSLAMALLDAQIAPSLFQIDAMDVSERVLAHAQQGIYGRNSFRSADLGFRDRHFQETGKGWLLDPKVRELVQFHHGNLLNITSMARGRTYDAIFCRNLLIYFDTETQGRAISTLERLLVPGGIFCVGPAETGLLAPFEFTHTRIPLTFAFRKEKPLPAPKPQPNKSQRPPAPAPALVPKAAPRTKPAPAALSPSLPIPDLQEAARLADEGRLHEVASLCHSHLLLAGPSAQAFYLLALVSDSAGRFDEATAYYRKALYLDPQHHDALLHFSILMAKRGQTAAAESLRSRARRQTEKAA